MPFVYAEPLEGASQVYMSVNCEALADEELDFVCVNCVKHWKMKPFFVIN
jgi:hypothetical protein